MGGGPAGPAAASPVTSGDPIAITATTATSGDRAPSGARGSHALCRSLRRFVRSSACLNLREVTDRSVRVCAAAFRASGFF